MSIESEVFLALKGLVVNRVYPDIAPDLTARPYITYQQVGGDAINYLDPTIPSKKNGRFQVNVWADTRSQAATLGRQVEDTLRVAAALQMTAIGAMVATFEPETGLRGTRQDFSLWQ